MKNLIQKIRMIPLTIRIKLMVIISILVFISLGTLTFISTSIFEEDMENIIKLMNSRTSTLLSEKILSDMEERKKSVFWMDTLQKSPASGSPEIRQLIRKAFQELPSTVIQFSCRYANAKCTLGYSMENKEKVDELEINSTDLIRTVMQKYLSQNLNGQILVKNISPDYKKPLMIIGFPVVKNNTLSGLLVSVVDVTHFLSMFDIRKGQTGKKNIYDSFMVDPQGQILIHPLESYILSRKSFDSHPAVRKMFTSQTRNGLIRFEYENEDFFGAYAKLSGYNLGVITTIKADKALEGVQIAVIRSILVSLLIMASAILFVYYFSKTISEPIRNLLSATREIEKGNFTYRVETVTADEIGDLTDSFNHMSHGLLERERLKGAFDRFVNKDIADAVLAGNLRLGGERKKVTIFFSDIRSFTAISEKMEPEQVVEFLNQYMTMMVGIIHRHNGTVDKFIGDAIMAVWGASEDDVSNCLDAALEMRYALIDYNKNRTRSQPEIKIGAGINTGNVLAGQIGSEDRLEYTVIGDAVNLASRIEMLNKPFGTDVLISENTYNEVKGKFKCISMESITVKGKSKPQKVFCVLGREGDTRTPGSLAALRKLADIKKPEGKISTEEEKKYETVKK